MKLTIKLILTVVCVANLLAIESVDAGDFRKGSMSRSKSSFSRGKSLSRGKSSSSFRGKSSSSSKMSRTPSFGSKSNPGFKKHSNLPKKGYGYKPSHPRKPVQFGHITDAPQMRTPIRPNLKPTNKDRILNVNVRQPVNNSPIKTTTMPRPKRAPILTGPAKSPITTRPGKSPIIKGRIPTPGKSPILTRPGTSPIKTLPGKSPIVTRPGKSPLPTGPIKGRVPNPGRLPGQSGDPDAGNPVKPLPNRGEPGKIGTPTQGILPGDTPPVIDEPIDAAFPGQGNGGNNGDQGGNYQEGDITAGNGKVVDQDFVDLINDGEFLHTGQPAPWDNPNDPFWDQEKPQDWKGYWPGNDPDFGVKLPERPELDPTEPPVIIDPERPDLGDTPPPIDCPPGDVPPPYCPPGGHVPPYCPPPVIIIDPIGPPPVACPPCVTTVCRPAVVAPIVEEEPVEQVLQLVTDRQNTLVVEGFGNVAGNAALQVNGLGLPLKVVAWNNEQLVLDVPMIGMVEPTPAKLFLFDAEMKVLAEIDVELLTPEMAGLEAPAAE
ncbi:MAG: hypothetical protein HUJ26_22760 [Planctomycetaceae bacterium]|nr:hypothetical protein [Planctomycetaceae bacterium]